MIFSWLRRRRRRRLRAGPFPDEWERELVGTVADYDALSADERQRFCDTIKVLVAEKNWEGCGGFEMTERAKVIISAQIAIMVLGLDDEYFDRVPSILVYPDAYVARAETPIHHNLVVNSHSPREGEAWYRGPVILAWPEVLAGARRETPGRNLVYHEFAHQLDMLNGEHADGIPPMDSAQQAEEWIALLDQEYERLIDDCERGMERVFDCYGTTNKAEFFAVATEAFLGDPYWFDHYHPALYRAFCRYFRQDPLVRFESKLPELGW